MLKLGATLRTDDMVFAALLTMEGYEPAMERQDGKRRVVWVVAEKDVDDDLVSLIDQYKQNLVRVEPQEFMRSIRLVRSALYELLGIQAERVDPDAISK
jgi:hypothetical protein